MTIGKKKKTYFFRKITDRVSSKMPAFRHRGSITLLSNVSSKALMLTAIFLIVVGVSYSELSLRFYKFVVNASSINEINVALATSDISSVTPELNIDGKVVSSSAESLDKRVYVLDEYFRVNNSPLYGQAKNFVKYCDQYGAPRDCITIPAIAKHETNLCKYNISAQMHNCLGWGGAGPNRIRFPDFKTHIETATRVLVQQYGVEYMVDPRLMETVFCGPQDECKGWGSRVLSIMKSIDDFGASLGVGRLSALR